MQQRKGTLNGMDAIRTSPRTIKRFDEPNLNDRAFKGPPPIPDLPASDGLDEWHKQQQSLDRASDQARIALARDKLNAAFARGIASGIAISGLVAAIVALFVNLYR